MGKAQALNPDSIDDLLASIRQAIHDEVSPPVAETPDPAINVHQPNRNLPRAPRLVATRPSQEPHSRPADLGGVRLEEALARLSKAGRMPPASSRPAAVPAAVEQRTQTSRLRPSLVEIGEAVAVEEIQHPITEEIARPRPAEPSFGKLGLQTSAKSEATNGHALLSLLNIKMESAPEVAAAPPARPELLSAEASSSAASAFHRLAEALVHRSNGAESAVEDVTRDMLRPLLKSWLDEHLPHIVERLVREEIERVARRRGR